MVQSVPASHVPVAERIGVSGVSGPEIPETPFLTRSGLMFRGPCQDWCFGFVRSAPILPPAEPVGVSGSAFAFLVPPPS